MTDSIIHQKPCVSCKEIKPLLDFSVDTKNKDDLNCVCRKCTNSRVAQYYKTKKGLISRIYNHQKEKSRKRNHVMPDYNLDKLRIWAISSPIFHSLHKEWIDSGYKKNKTPSFDRLDDYKPYSFDNLQIITWEENNQKCNSDIRNGINNKMSKSVIQLTKDKEFISSFYSIEQAARDTGIWRSSIGACCHGRVNSAGGYNWEFAL